VCITWEIVKNVAFQAHPRPIGSESAFGQDLQGIPMHIKIYEALIQGLGSDLGAASHPLGDFTP
jgi:hypothetical protein